MITRIPTSKIIENIRESFKKTDRIFYEQDNKERDGNIVGQWYIVYTIEIIFKLTLYNIVLRFY